MSVIGLHSIMGLLTMVCWQEQDPYSARLLPINPAASNDTSVPSLLLPKSSPQNPKLDWNSPAEQGRANRRTNLPAQTISSRSLFGRRSEASRQDGNVGAGTSPGERLPEPRQGRSESDPAAGTTSNTRDSDDAGIVRLLRPLVVEPQARETLTQRYPNGQVMIEREVSQDSHGNYMNDGTWKMLDLQQQIMGIGRFQNGQMVGLWRRLHDDRSHPWLGSSEFRGFQFPLVSSAEFKAGLLHGVWVIKDAQERKLVEFTYEEGKRHGTGTWWYPNGQMRRRVHFQEDRLHGVWSEWAQDSTLQTENWFTEGKRINRETNYYSENRPESELSFLEAPLELVGQDDWWNARPATYAPVGTTVQTGPVKAWYDNGQKHLAGYYRDGQRHGEFAWWHPNGNRKLIGQYENGARIGSWTWWHENGLKAAEGTYRDDQPIGDWLAWDESGELLSRQELGMGRETLARPTIPERELESEGELEELPPQFELEAPPVPQLDLVPPIGESTQPTPIDSAGNGSIDPDNGGAATGGAVDPTPTQSGPPPSGAADSAESPPAATPLPVESNGTEPDSKLETETLELTGNLS